MTTSRNPQSDKAGDPQRSDQQILLVFKALSHPFRLELLRQLSGEEACVCNLVERTGRPQPYVSQQMSVLRRAGLVTSWRERQQIHYRINLDRLHRALSLAAEVGGAGQSFWPSTAPSVTSACCPPARVVMAENLP